MVLIQSLRYISNKDSSYVAYKKFDETSIDRYPTFSICLVGDSSYPLQYIFNDNLVAEVGINDEEYNSLLKGSAIRRNLWGATMDFSDILKIDHDSFKLKLETLLSSFKFTAQDSTTSGSTLNTKNVSLPFYVTYADPDTICFSRKSEVKSGVIRVADKLYFDDLEYLKDAVTYIEIYVHHPGQLLRSLGKPNFEARGTDLNKYNSRILLKLNHVSVLRKRPNANIPCDPDLQDDDNRYMKEVIMKIVV